MMIITTWEKEKGIIKRIETREKGTEKRKKDYIKRIEQEIIMIKQARSDKTSLKK